MSVATFVLGGASLAYAPAEPTVRDSAPVSRTVAALSGRSAPADEASSRSSLGGSSQLLGLGCVAAVAGTISARRASRRNAQRSRAQLARCATSDIEAASGASSEGTVSGPQDVGRGQLLRALGGVSALSSLPAPANAKSVEEAQKALTSFGLPDLLAAKEYPDGWKVVVEPIGVKDQANYGKFNLGKELMIVNFGIPFTWVISRPNIDFNGTAGTVQANDYGKGDVATLWVDTNFEGKLEDAPKAVLAAEMKKALGQKSNNIIENFSIDKIIDGAPGYRLVEYGYEIESGAGFSLSRRGYASFAQIGDDKNLQVLWTGVVEPRWSGMEKTLKTMVSTFRVGKVPQGVSSNVIAEFNQG
mmetsp:Transcript_63308/g.137736  ORF Transcript_63308/g.137736 Transcript_63308/m.137736 type:complete len:359 (-) Transcript_63308:272-1348(-)